MTTTLFVPQTRIDPEFQKTIDKVLQLHRVESVYDGNTDIEIMYYIDEGMDEIFEALQFLFKDAETTEDLFDFGFDTVTYDTFSQLVQKIQELIGESNAPLARFFWISGFQMVVFDGLFEPEAKPETN